MTATTEEPRGSPVRRRVHSPARVLVVARWNRVLNLGDAIAAPDKGEIEPGATIALPDSGVRALPGELVERICPPPQPAGEPPAWLVTQAQVIAAATAAKLKQLIRTEVRAALRANRQGPKS